MAGLLTGDKCMAQRTACCIHGSTSAASDIKKRHNLPEAHEGGHDLHQWQGNIAPRALTEVMKGKPFC